MKLNLLLQPTSTTENQSNHLQVAVELQESASVGDLKNATINALPPNSHSSNLTSEDINLWYSGQRLQSENALEFYGITQNALDSNQNLTIYITLGDGSDNDSPITEIKKKVKKSKSKSKSKSKKCTFLNCSSMPLRMVGDCQLCQGKFCSKHRLLESHQCKGLKGWKDTCFERNAIKLQSEQTVASKV